MGGMKDVMAMMEELGATARLILRDAKVLTECEFHGTYFNAEGEITDAYKLANARITSGQLKVGSRFSRRDVSDAIKREYDDHAGLDYCVSCDHALRD